MTFHPERYIGVAFLALVALVIAPPALDRWAVSQLPRAVKAAVEEQLPESSTTRVESRTDGGRTVYDLHTRQGRERYVVRVAPDGQVLRMARAVGILDLPDALYDQLRERCPAAHRIAGVTAVTERDGKKRYEVRVVAGGQPRTVVLDADGPAGGAPDSPSSGVQVAGG